MNKNIMTFIKFTLLKYNEIFGKAYVLLYVLFVFDGSFNFHGNYKIKDLRGLS